MSSEEGIVLQLEISTVCLHIMAYFITFSRLRIGCVGVVNWLSYWMGCSLVELWLHYGFVRMLAGTSGGSLLGGPGVSAQDYAYPNCETDVMSDECRSFLCRV